MNEKDNMNRYYELTDETIEFDGHTLHRIVCTESFRNVLKGTYGGFIEGYKNLKGTACVNRYAYISDRAVVDGNAYVSGNSVLIGGDVCIYGSVIVRSSSRFRLDIIGSANIGGDAVIESSYDYIVFKNWWSSGRYFTWTRSNDMWRVGCFYGTGKELIAKAYKDSEVSGREYERVVKYVEAIKKVNKPTIFQRLKKLFCTTYDLCVN